MKKTNKFYDTSSLLLKVGEWFNEEEPILVSSITLDELENIKTSFNKDFSVKYAARKLLHELKNHVDNYEVVVFTEDMLAPISTKQLTITSDLKIVATAYSKLTEYPDLTFVTDDFCLYHIAKLFFNSVEMIDEDQKEEYTGFKEIVLSDQEMATFYENYTSNPFDLHINEYLIIRDQSGEIVDRLCWTGEDYRTLNYHDFKSQMFGSIKPFKDDIYQAMFADSLCNNKITMVKGPAGSGKTFLSLAYLMHQLEKGKIDKIIIFCNTVATKNSAKLGYYPGTRDEKLLDSQIGNLLSSKFGDKMMVETMIEKNQLILLPLSDIRGYDTSGMNAGVYISEAQNMDISLMKLVLQRIGSDAICIIDGDSKAQVDDIDFAGANNGMRRASEIFRGHEIYGEVTLQKIHRSRIAEIAELM